MSQAIALPLMVPGNSLDAYIQRVKSIPILSADAERELAVRFRDESDVGAARDLVLAHLRFVVRVASGYSGYGLPVGDLIQEGNIGLMKAVKRFDPDKGVRLVSFAVHWIRAEIHEFILKNWRIVKVATTKAQRKLFFNLRSAKKRLGWLNQDEINSVATDLGVSARDVVEMERRLSAYDTSYDLPDDSRDDAGSAPANFLEDLRYEPEKLVADQQLESQRMEKLYSGLRNLDERTRIIIQQRWLQEPKTTLQELAERFGVSAERIRQLEKAAFKKLRNGFTELDVQSELA